MHSIMLKAAVASACLVPLLALGSSPPKKAAARSTPTAQLTCETSAPASAQSRQRLVNALTVLTGPSTSFRISSIAADGRVHVNDLCTDPGQVQLQNARQLSVMAAIETGSAASCDPPVIVLEGACTMLPQPQPKK